MQKGFNIQYFLLHFCCSKKAQNFLFIFLFLFIAAFFIFFMLWSLVFYHVSKICKKMKWEKRRKNVSLLCCCTSTWMQHNRFVCTAIMKIKRNKTNKKKTSTNLQQKKYIMKKLLFCVCVLLDFKKYKVEKVGNE